MLKVRWWLDEMLCLMTQGLSLQTRNDARVVVAGSLDLFTNAFLQAKDFTTAGGAK